ncbi:DUF3289 family protein [Chitinophagaceae bacterium LWZ2-11]
MKPVFIPVSATLMPVPGSCLPKIIASSKIKKYLGADGKPNEDMMYYDNPSVLGLNISADLLYGKTHEELFGYMRNLITNTSKGPYQQVALRMLEHFKSRRGGEFKNALLNQLVDIDVSFITWKNYFYTEFTNRLKEVQGDVCKISSPFEINRFSFDDFNHKWNGMGIMIHQVHAIEAELVEFEYGAHTGNYKGIVKFHLYDHFGLDKRDVMEGHKRMFQPYGSEEGFKAWWILQHYKGYQPFLTHIEIIKKFNHVE